MKPDLNTFIISDTHFGHKNIIKYCNRPENHNEVMFNNWLREVRTDDIVLHLGDLTFKSKNTINFNTLTGDKYLIKGNHDHKSNDWYLSQGFTVLPRRIGMRWNGLIVLFTHYPEENTEGWNINIHGHIHNNGYITKNVGRKLYINVSVEVMDYKPVRLREILERM